MDMSFDLSPDIATMWWCIGVAVVLIAAGALLTVRRRSQERRPGLAVAVLLVLAAIACYGAYEAYFPSCPRNLWCQAGTAGGARCTCAPHPALS